MNLTIEGLPQAVNQLFNKLEQIEKLLQEKSKQHPTEQQDKLLTVKETAELLHLTVPTIYSKVSRKELPVMKRGKRLLFSRLELLAYLKEGRKKTNAEIEAAAETYLSENKKD